MWSALLVLLCMWPLIDGQGCTIDKPLDFPNLSICGKPQTEFCSELTATGPDPAPVPTACALSPEGMIMFMRLSKTCPCGFDDVTDDFEHRYVSIGGSVDEIGTAGEPLGARSRVSSGLVSGLMPMQLNFEAGSSEKSLLAQSETPSVSVSVSSASIAPSLALRVCERSGECVC